MAKGRSETQWGHTSNLMAMIHNASMGAKKALSASEFNPYYTKPARTKEEVRAAYLAVALAIKAQEGRR